MAKGDDALRKKKNKQNRKRVRSSESAVSARVAAIIATKRRRKAGKRRICEGMCYTLPTPDDPFNERHGKKEAQQKKNKKSKADLGEKQNKKKMLAESGENNLEIEQSCPSKFLIVCLNAIKDAWREEGEIKEHDVSSWGLELWRCCSSGLSNVLDTSGSCATREQIAWLVSVVSDIVARKEKQGILVSSPYLLYIVPTQEMAVKVRSVCKPLKALGIHTVSLHPGASIQHQLHGLKSCEPEFLISTPGRLLELVSLNAIDISSVSLLVVDGLGIGSAEEIGYSDKINSIKETITSNPRIVVFSNHCDEMAASAHNQLGTLYINHCEEMAASVYNLLGGPITRLSLNNSVTSRSAFISQYVHLCLDEEPKVDEIQELLLQIVCCDECKFTKMLIVTKSERKIELTASQIELTASRLNLENCTISNASSSGSFTLHHREKAMRVVVKDHQSLQLDKVEDFDLVLIADLPSSIEEYIEILTRIARHSVTGTLHSLFCRVDAHLVKSLINLLTECKQIVPEFLLDLVVFMRNLRQR